MSQKFPHVKLEDVANVRAGIPSREIDRPSEDGVIPVKMIGPAALIGTYLGKVEGEDVSLTGPVATRHGLKEGDILTSSRGIFRASLLEKNPSSSPADSSSWLGPFVTSSVSTPRKRTRLM